MRAQVKCCHTYTPQASPTVPRRAPRYLGTGLSIRNFHITLIFHMPWLLCPTQFGDGTPTHTSHTLGIGITQVEGFIPVKSPKTQEES